MATADDFIEQQRVALWTAAQAQTATLSAATDAAYAQAVATQPNGCWDTSQNRAEAGQFEWSGSLTTGNYTTNGQAPTPVENPDFGKGGGVILS